MLYVRSVALPRTSKSKLADKVLIHPRNSSAARTSSKVARKILRKRSKRKRDDADSDSDSLTPTLSPGRAKNPKNGNISRKNRKHRKKSKTTDFPTKPGGDSEDEDGEVGSRLDAISSSRRNKGKTTSTFSWSNLADQALAAASKKRSGSKQPENESSNVASAVSTMDDFQIVTAGQSPRSIFSRSSGVSDVTPNTPTSMLSKKKKRNKKKKKMSKVENEHANDNKESAETDSSNSKADSIDSKPTEKDSSIAASNSKEQVRLVCCNFRHGAMSF